MAQVQRDTRDGRWQARWRDPSGRQRKKSFRRRVDAQKWLDQHLAEMHRGQYVDPSGSRMLVGPIAEEWAAGLVHLKPSTAARYRGVVKNHVIPSWGSWRLGSIGRQDIETWVGTLVARGLRPASIRQTYRVLSLILDAAVAHGRIGRNPASGVRLPRVAAGEPVYLSAAEVGRLAVAAHPDDLAILVLAFTGLRFGELAALRARRVDLVRGRLQITESVTEVQGKLEFTSPKTHQTRSVPVPATLLRRLAVIVTRLGPDDLVFTAPEGGTLRLRNWRARVFDPARERVELGHLTPHDLRHTAASLAIAAGANVKAVQRMLGHASAAMTLDVYAGLFGDDLDAVGVALDRDVPQMCHIDPAGSSSTRCSSPGEVR